MMEGRVLRSKVIKRSSFKSPNMTLRPWKVISISYLWPHFVSCWRDSDNSVTSSLSLSLSLSLSHILLLLLLLNFKRHIPNLFIMFYLQPKVSLKKKCLKLKYNKKKLDQELNIKLIRETWLQFHYVCTTSTTVTQLLVLCSPCNFT